MTPNHFKLPGLNFKLKILLASKSMTNNSTVQRTAAETQA